MDLRMRMRAREVQIRETHRMAYGLESAIVNVGELNGNPHCATANKLVAHLERVHGSGFDT